MKFLSQVAATLVGIFMFVVLAFFGLLVVGAVVGSSSTGTEVKANSVIELDLSMVTVDYAGKFDYEDFDYYEANHDGLADVLAAIRSAKTDSNIKGISILNDNSNLGMAQYKALRDALHDFSRSGKFVMAYANTLTQKEYYLNSAAQEIYLNPLGELEFKGLSTELLFFKDFQDQYGIKMDVIRHGKYKSAVEPFLENKMSPANRLQTESLLHSVWNSMVEDIAQSRKISVAQLNGIANQLQAQTPESAKALRLVDQVAYEDQYHAAIKKKLGVAATDSYNTIPVLDYAENNATTVSDYTAKSKIAIVYAQGDIGRGEGDVITVGEGSMRRALQEARDDEAVKAIVLRVDSPGGDALTSELIWREIELTKKVKPVVVSMGNYAASGGYYIACNADRIFAEKTTITGSIGVFGLLPNFSKLTNKMGIHAEQVATHQNAAEYSVFQPLNPGYAAYAQKGVERVYSTFLSRVATGRKMTVAQVDSLAQGRVWSGADAKKMGLVDEIGGLNAAIAYAAKKTKTKDYSTQNYPEYKRDFSAFLGQLGMPFFSSKEAILQEQVGAENYKLIQQLRKVQARKGIQAALPFDIQFH
jgi:protease-4